MSDVQAQIREIDERIRKLRNQPRSQYMDRRITQLKEQKAQLRLRGRIVMRR